ncbi:MAG: tetratricopeptide repeat protein [Bacteroidota bacterium]|nr:tetratricopeptide repeat protein [Bacteroidota bacterium]
MRKTLLISLYFIIAINGFSQNRAIDSLSSTAVQLAKNSSYTNDTVLMNLLNMLSREFINIGKYNSADSISIYHHNLSIQKLTLDIEHKNSFFKKSEAKALSNRGIVASCQGDQQRAIELFVKSLTIFTEVNDKQNISKLAGNIGNALKDQGSYAKALEFYFKALKISENLENKSSTAIHLANIGNVYRAQENYKKALEYYLKALAIAEEIKDKRGIAVNLSNIGIVYKTQGEYEKALEFYFRALKMAESLKHKLLITNTLGNIGSVYNIQNKNNLAIEYYTNALVLAIELGDKAGISRQNGNLGNVYFQLQRNRESEKSYKEALELSVEVADLDLIKQQRLGLSMLYEREGRWKESLNEFQLYTICKDSLFNEENSKKTLRSELNFEFEKKATADSVKNLSEQKVKDAAIVAQLAQLKQERTQRYSLYGGLFIVLIFSVFILNRFQITRKQKKVIEQQKLLVEEKNKEVIDSINYARRIQDALLKEKDHASSFIPEHFILFKAKDIVSGDFYWSTVKQSYWYFCVADCTGHGVPGAFMSMLGIAYLNEITASESILTPAGILDLLRDKIVKELKQKGESGESKDGMDISLIRFDLENNELQWAGAYNPLWIVQKEKPAMLEVAPDKQPIGYTISPSPFKNHIYQASPGDTIYLLTDGYADQFGGPKGKKFKYKQLKETILEIQTKPLILQKESLNKTFEKWRGDLEQLDDVTFVGIRI